MRDIDFDELDKAVNSFLGNGPKTSPKTEVKIEEKPAEVAPREFIRAPRRGIDAGSFHRASVVEIAQKREEIVEKPVERVEVQDFAKFLNQEEKVMSEVGGGKSVDDFIPEIQDSAVEAPILDENSKSDKDISIAEKQEISSEFYSQDANLRAEKRDVMTDALALGALDYHEPVLETVEVTPPARESRSVVVPARPGVYKLEEDEDIKTFSGDKFEAPIFEEKTENEAPIESVELPVEDEVKVNVSIKKFADESAVEKSETAPSALRKLPILTDEMIAQKTSPAPKVEPIEASAPKKIGVQFDVSDEEKSEEIHEEKAAATFVEETKPEVKPEPKSDFNFENIASSFEPAKPAPAEEKIITQVSSTAVKSSTEEIKTPFVSNVKIDKRPLGAAAGAPMNFDMKKDFARRKQEIRRAKMNNPVPQAPMMATEEYASPVLHKKKKSGWGVVLAILLVTLLVSAGVGLAVYYFSLNN